MDRIILNHVMHIVDLDYTRYRTKNLPNSTALKAAVLNCTAGGRQPTFSPTQRHLSSIRCPHPSLSSPPPRPHPALSASLVRTRVIHMRPTRTSPPSSPAHRTDIPSGGRGASVGTPSSMGCGDFLEASKTPL